MKIWICRKCGAEYTAEELRELRMMGEAYSVNPFMCPDCTDAFQRKDLEDQFDALMKDDEGR